ncbi:MAG: hypothetical protein E3J94_07625 [Desulfobacteraceae bacterium]|nr:MAG: hypothetical protein E3J94_07625 [Desulfobacteraceae bacterium]
MTNTYSRKFRLFLQVLILFAISYYVTVVPTLLLGEQAWRVIYYVFCPLMICHLLFSHRSGVVPKPPISNTAFYLFVAPFLFFVFVELVAAILSNNGIIKVRSLIVCVVTFSILLSLASLIGSRTDADEGFRFILKPYVYFCLFIALAGTLAWLLIHFGLISMGSWDPRDVAPIGNLYRKSGYGLRQTYSFPLFLGVIINQKIPYLNIYRASGLSFEPHIAALFVTPSLFMLRYTLVNWSRKKVLIANGFTICFLFLSMSTTNHFAMMFIGLLLLLRMKNAVYKFPFCILLAVMLFYYGGSLMNNTNYFLMLQDKITNSKSLASFNATVYALEDLKSTQSFMDLGIIQDKVGVAVLGPIRAGLLSLVAVTIQWVIPMFGGLTLFFSRKRTAMFGLCVIYVLLHSLKDLSHTLQYPFYFFILFITAMAYSIPPQKSRVI